MNPNAKASQEYLKNAVMTASQEHLQMMLYDGAIRFTTRGMEALEKKDYEGVFNGFDRAQRIVLEMNNGLRREVNPELVDRMSSLYDFIYRRLIEASVQHDMAAAEEALKILRHMRETWALLMQRLSEDSEPNVSQSERKSPLVVADDNPSSLSLEG